MPTHDYILSNQSGASFRTDLNNALAAIVSNNSNSSSPATTYAYQWWADTTANILKIRNSANNAWINLFTLAGGIDVDAASNFNEDVTFTGASANIVFDKSDSALEFADNAKAKFGAGDDLVIFHDSSDSYIQDTGTGQLNLTGSTISINNAANNEIQARFIENSKVELRFDGSEKMETNSTGINLIDKVITFQGQSNRNIRFRDGENDMIFEFDSGDFYRQNIGNSQHEFFTGNTQRVVIDSSGVTQMAVGSSVLFSRNTGGTNTTAVQFKTAGSQVGKIFFNNSDTFYSTGSSDRTLKKNFENWTETILTSFKNLNAQKFNFLQEENTDQKHKGFIAQDLADQFPEAYPIDPETDKYGFNPSGMVVYLMKAIQELEAKVAALEAA